MGARHVANAVGPQLELFGRRVSGLRFLLGEEAFTPEEIRLYAHPCATPNAASKTKVQRWLDAGGGIGGKALGIHADHVRPYERVRDRFAALLAALRD